MVGVRWTDDSPSHVIFWIFVVRRNEQGLIMNAWLGNDAS